MYCKRCGARIADEAMYCPRCGTATGAQAGRNRSGEGHVSDTALGEVRDEVASSTSSASPLRFVVVAICLALVASAFLLPVLTVGQTWGQRVDVGVIGLIGGLWKSNDGSEAMAHGGILAGLLLVGVGSMVLTSVLCLARPHARHLGWSWGMAVYGVGLMVVVALRGPALQGYLGDLVARLGETAARVTVSLGAGAFVATAGGIVCGVVDLVRSQRG